MLLEYRDNSAPIAGYYEEATDTIYIASGLPPLIAECVYLHERQHQKCYRADCGCYTRASNNDLAEFHAFRGELMAVLERDSVALAQAYLGAMKECKAKIAQNPKLWSSHKKAVVRIEKLKAYREVQKLSRRKRCHCE